MNGGTCIDGINSYICQCGPGYTGSNCQFHINECDSQPCQSGGTCIDHVGYYTCHCPFGYTGLHCDVSSVLVSSECSETCIFILYNLY